MNIHQFHVSVFYWWDQTFRIDNIWSYHRWTDLHGFDDDDDDDVVQPNVDYNDDAHDDRLSPCYYYCVQLEFDWDTLNECHHHHPDDDDGVYRQSMERK